jgi:O-antigen/teichoic acid export membrane protein
MSVLRIMKNALANLSRGSAIALVTLLLPPLLTRVLSKESYSAWLLVMQLSSYVIILDLNIQMSVSRFVAYYSEIGDLEKRDNIVSTAFVMLSVLALFGLLGIVFLSCQLPCIFRDIPIALVSDTQLALMIIGGSLAITLPTSAFVGVFLGVQRYDMPAWIIGSSKLLAGFLTALVACYTHNILLMSSSVALGSFMSAIGLTIALKKNTHNISLSIKTISKHSLLEISEYSLSFLSWNIGIILASGLDATIVSFFDYKSLVYYSLAASLVSIISGIQSTVIVALMPEATKMGVRGEKKELGDLLISATRYTAIALIVVSIPILILEKLLLSIWIGNEYAIHVEQFLQVLILANFIRQICLPYCMVVSSINEQRKIILVPLLEGLTSMLFGYIFIHYVGAIGVAFGTLIGAIASLLAHYSYTVTRIDGIEVIDKRNFIQAVVKPLIAAFPCLIIITYSYVNPQINMLTTVCLFLISFSLMLLSLWQVAILSTEKKKILHLMFTKTTT